jgi:hypothetical protein
VNGLAEANQAYGALHEGLFIARNTLERAFRVHLEPLISGDAWRSCGEGFDDINVFMESLRLDKFKMIADERRAIVRRIKELQPAVSNAQIARTLGIGSSTVDRDVAPNGAASEKNASGSNGQNSESAPNGAPPNGDNEWFTPVEYIERARRGRGPTRRSGPGGAPDHPRLAARIKGVLPMSANQQTATPPPTLAQQIDAVQWAWAHAQETGRRAHMRPAEIVEQARRLEWAIETLRTLEYGSAVAR